jgi:transposase-like protein
VDDTKEKMSAPLLGYQTQPLYTAGKKDALMTTKETRVVESAQEPKDVLQEILQAGARKMLVTAIENEVAEYIEKHAHLTDENGHRQVVRNGSMPERKLVTGVGQISIKQPRVHDRREDQRFTSSILPPYMRRAPSIDALIPALYLKGVSTGDFSAKEPQAFQRQTSSA